MKPASHVPISYLLPNWVRAPSLPLLAGNELRAIFPIFLSAIALMLLASNASEDFRRGIALLTYGFGCIAVTSVSFGHDFAHRTLLTTLSLPISREHLWSLRFRISIFAMAALTICGGWALQIYQILWNGVFFSNTGLPFALLIFLIPPLAALCIAPWFTLLCRSALAGTVFTMSVPFAIFFVSRLLAVMVGPRMEMTRMTVEAITLCVFFIAFGFACVTGFISARLRFLNLEVIDREDTAFTGFGGFRVKKNASVTVRRDRRSSVWVQLASKELRVQTITLVPALGMVITAFSLRQPDTGTFIGETLMLATILWAVAIGVILGAVGSAEERQLGVIESQALLPVSRFAQWILKAAVLMLLAQLLAVNLPIWILRSSVDPGRVPFPEPRWWSISAMSIVSLSLYLSSFCRTTMKAVLLSLPFAGIFLVLLNFMQGNEQAILQPSRQFFTHTEIRVFPVDSSFIDIFFAPIIDAQRLALIAPYLCLAVIIFLLLRFACTNHFSAEQSGSRCLRQIGWLAGLTVASFILCLSFSLRAGIL